jgi:hemerythrin-like domain-containing protein/rubrerythrin
MMTIETSNALYAHAIAIEREAAERYAEFAARMSDLGNDEVAAVFATLGRGEAQHLEALQREARELVLPPIDAEQYAWLDSGSPETPARELVFRMMTPRDALQIALAAEQRAQTFFLRTQRIVQDPALRELAQWMAAEESDHVARIQRALQQIPDPAPDWSAVLETETAAAAVQPVARWHRDHVYFKRVLDLLEKQLDIFHAGEQPDYERMLDIIYYLRRFTDQLHHPREDVAFACLARRNPGMALPLARLAQEHRVIAHVGERLEKGLEQVAGGAYIERADIEALAATYLVYYRAHIAREEKDVLPAAARVLTAEDWQAVQAASQAPEAPFRELRRQIVLEA